ncbi:flagellar basal-body rod modification protein FlgD [Roseovarius azorensis]|uniref:Basal-body rod modification protein FlgD n=1 Tax=Roseovarius azorensis TaxID=1287727 RepID=A0A1H7R0P4_9RHOB|nr:flagellar hook capping FlgD N-terminal domain-containing protein [Roseovarius azorensis]SEL53679.1 flagellar basal-body rod modification protein FlgD [Roseovarius azorensis]
METTSAAPPPVTGVSRAATANTAPPQNKGVLSSDFETFLKMLTVQMRNQDPLNPIESADFAVQLAAFSTVEQQVRTNDLLVGLGSRLATLGLGQLSGWIGLEARALTPVSFRGQPVTLTATVDPLADAAQLVVTDAKGIIVQKQTIPLQSGRIEWAGLDTAGLPLPEGTYRISAHSLSQGETIARHDVEVHGRITEARLDNGETVVVMENGEIIPASRILGLRPAEN